MPTKAIKQRFQAHYTRWAVFALIILGTLGIIGRLFISERLNLPVGDTVWTVAIKVQIKDAQKDGQLIISPPWSRSQIRIVSQQLQHTGMRLIRTTNRDIQKRNILLQVINPGNLSASAVFDVHIKQTPQVNLPALVKPLDEENRTLYLKSEEAIDIKSREITTLLTNLSANVTSNDELLERIFTYTHRNIVNDTRNLNDDVEIALRTNKATTLGRVRTMVSLCRAASIPARIVSGLILEESVRVLPYHWLEVYTEDKWVAYDPEKGYVEKIPNNYLAFNRGDSYIVTTQDIGHVHVTYNIRKNYNLTGLNIFPERRFIDIVNFERLHPDTREDLGLLLLLPLGALITAFSRHFLGIRGYGTFTPTLLALSVVYAGWITALVLLSIVIALGVSGRSAMPDKLSRISRLAVVFTIVAMSVVLGISLMEFFNFNTSEHVVLLPIVILTSLVDRFYSAAEDYGIYTAMRRMVWTIVIGLLIYPLLKLNSIGALLLAYPEAHFITLSIILMISIYKGKQLSEFAGFSWIKEPVPAKVKKPEAISENRK